MPYLVVRWPTAGLISLAALACALGLRRWGRPRSAAAIREISLVGFLFTAWQVIGSVTQRNVDAAESNALAIWQAQQWLRLPSELSLQQAVLPHDGLVQASNAYYVYGHFNPLIAVLIWVFWRHRAAYGRVRLWLCLLTASAFVMHWIPVAPPRLMPELGFRDMALERGQSVYGSFGSGIPGQLLAMPSLHVGWAVLIAYVVITLSTSRWRWLIVLHPIAMTLNVAVTANHWWADGAASAVLLALCVAGERAVRAVLARPNAFVRTGPAVGATLVADLR